MPAGATAEGALAAMHQVVHFAAEPAVPGETVKAAINRAARRLGLPPARVLAHWYRRARQVTAAEWLLAQERREELLRLRAAALEADLAATRGMIEELRADAATVAPMGAIAAGGAAAAAVGAPGGAGAAPGGIRGAAAREGAGAAAAAAPLIPIGRADPAGGAMGLFWR